MINLTKALNAWGTPGFREVLRDEIERLDAEMLPLQQGMSQGSYASGESLRAMIISVSDGQKCIRIKAGIFFEGIIAGCNCADDPTPVDKHPEYCEMQFDIDKLTSQATVSLLQG